MATQIAPARHSPPTAQTGIRVLHVITSLGPGGAERQLELLLAGSSNDASAVCLYFEGLVGESITARGGRVELLGMAGLAKLTALARLSIVIRRQSPDVVHVHLLSGQFFGTLAARLAGVPVVVSTEHSLMDDTIEGRPLSRWLRAIYLALQRLTNLTVAVSETTRRRLTRWGVRHDRIVVIENAVDFDAVRYDPTARLEARRDMGIAGDAKVLGAVGRLVGVKRFDVLLRSVAPLLQRHDAHLVIIGEGPMAGELAELGERLAVADRVHLMGPQRDVPRLLNGFDIFISPSRDETFGVAVLESIGNGLPTVYEECPAIDDVGAAPPGATKIDSSGVAGLEVMRVAVEEKLSNLGRRPVPGGLVARYGAGRLARDYDDLHCDLYSRQSRHRRVRRVRGGDSDSRYGLDRQPVRAAK